MGLSVRKSCSDPWCSWCSLVFFLGVLPPLPPVSIYREMFFAGREVTPARLKLRSRS